ncbi:MAG: hypothetical protein PHD03_04570 [Bacilli bacterium]|nr:hypothetical protein [Bacilli bacterium]MDD4608243.1 hypothetical protein [Bacilli bacterium]
MKIIPKIIPVIMMLVTTFLSIFFLDVNQSRKYLQIDSYEKKFIRIDYNENIKIDGSIIDEILQLAKANNVIIQKANFSNIDSNVRNVYFSFDKPEELYKFIGDNFRLKQFNSDMINNNAFISTYYHNDDNQIAIIPDLLKNDYYNYYKFDKLISDGGNLYGEYLVYYKNYSDFDKFSNGVKNLLGQDIVSFSIFNNLYKYIIIIIFGSVSILMLFYFIFQIYETYYKSQQIGCMKLLGYSESKIANIIMGKKIKMYFLFELFLLLSSFVFVKNINFFAFIFLFSINLVLIVLTILINYICVKIIFHGYNISNILKKQNIAIKIAKTSGKLKVITTALIIITLSILFNNLSTLYSELKVYQNSKELLQYGVLASFNADSEERFDYQKHSELYKNIVNNEHLNTFYANFDYYIIRSEKEKELGEELEKNGTFFKYGSVDKNYLEKEKIDVYDLNNNIVDISEINHIFFLFPKSKKGKIELFKEFYQRRSKDEYQKYNIDNKFEAYVYDDKLLNSYRLDQDIKYVNSPILRVINENLRLSYIESSLGINIFGTSLETSLKIEIINNKKKTFEILKKEIEKTGLENLISIDNFISFSDYFNDEIRLSKIITFTTFSATSILFLVYLIISIQVISLYVKSEIQNVTVKYLLGYNSSKIFSAIIDKNMIYNMSAVILSGLILILINYFNILIYLVSISIFLVVDLIVTFVIINIHDFSKIHLQLKGENYD